MSSPLKTATNLFPPFSMLSVLYFQLWKKKKKDKSESSFDLLKEYLLTLSWSKWVVIKTPPLKNTKGEGYLLHVFSFGLMLIVNFRKCCGSRGHLKRISWKARTVYLSTCSNQIKNPEMHFIFKSIFKFCFYWQKNYLLEFCCPDNFQKANRSPWGKSQICIKTHSILSDCLEFFYFTLSCLRHIAKERHSTVLSCWPILDD